MGELLRVRRSGDPLSVILCDVDHFKDVNDGHGHPTGDAVLRTMAALLADRVRGTDFVARLGGDEFGIVCAGTSIDKAEALARTLGDLARETVFPGGSSVTLSFGVADLAPDETSTEAMLHRADAALYRAKATRDTVCV